MANTATGPDRAALRRALDELATRGGLRLQAEAAARAQERALAREAPWLLAGPAVLLAVQLVQHAAAAGAWAPSAGQVVLAALVPWALAVLLARQRAARAPVARAAAIGLFDGPAGAAERLVSADELLRAGAASPFAVAALEDARWFLRPARAVRLGPAPRPPALRGRRRLGGAALGAALLAGFVLVLGGSGATPAGGALVADLPGATDAGGSGPRRASGTPPEEPASAAAEALPEGLPPSEAGEAAVSREPGELPDEARRKEGVGGSGRSSRAESSRGMSDARGAPTNQGQESKRPEARKPLKPEKKKKRKKKDFEKPPETRKAAGEESGSTSGRGSSRGSNRNPVTSDWTSKDQVTTEEDEEIEDDEDVDDETEDSEARGGVQPNLRDRKPPVSRDLGIGFGNQPNPNANGRGGPSQPKKSRGTASLVLGVPIPDRVKGRPNPGKTKVTQERVEPRRERAGSAEAEARAPREGPSSVLARPEMPGWLRAFVRDYFLRARTKESRTR